MAVSFWVNCYTLPLISIFPGPKSFRTEKNVCNFFPITFCPAILGKKYGKIQTTLGFFWSWYVIFNFESFNTNIIPVGAVFVHVFSLFFRHLQLLFKSKSERRSQITDRMCSFSYQNLVTINSQKQMQCLQTPRHLVWDWKSFSSLWISG